MYDVRACRGCLCTKGKLEKITKMTKKIYVAVTGIQVDLSDGLPTYLCSECHNHIRKAMTFRRRCLRAYYVLKEIMSVRKQVTLNDIITVSRKRTNLKSPYEYTKPQNNTYYIIENKKPDIDTLITTIDKYEPEEKTAELVKQEVDKKSLILHIDIEPDVTSMLVVDDVVNEEIIETVEEPAEVNMEETEPIEQEKEEEEVFEKEDDSDEIVVREENVEKKKKNLLAFKWYNVSVALAAAKIRVLDTEEQQIAFQKRLHESWFRVATYKCALCIIIMNSLEDLMTHVEEHNKAQSFPYVCMICKSKFETEDKLSLHASMVHLYEYTCKKCNMPPIYNLNQLGVHYRDKHKKSEEEFQEELSSKFERLKNYYNIIPTKPELMYLKMSMATSKHRCNVCDMKFVSLEFLRAHFNGHKPVRTRVRYECDICGVNYTTSKSLAKHMKTCHIYTYQCRQCKEVAFNINEAKYHLDHKHVPGSPQCEFCFKQFKSNVGLRHHRVVAHYGKIYKDHCNVCGESFLTLMRLYQHQFTAHEMFSLHDPSVGDKDFYCAICRFQFLSLKSYQVHAFRHEHEETKTFENACSFCKLAFDSADEHQEHIRNSCKALNKYPQKCTICNLIIPSYMKHVQHHRRDHPDVRLRHAKERKLCELCGQSVVDLAEHRRRHGMAGSLGRVNQSEMFDCALCYPARKVRGVACYASHVVRVHTARPYVCTLCPSAYRWLSECRDHILKKHAPVLLYKCIICLSDFSHPDFLRNHTIKEHNLEVNIPPPEPRGSIKLWVYPDMKLNLSLLDVSILENINVELWDYMHEKQVVLDDFTDYVVLDRPEVGPRKKKKQSKQKRLGRRKKDDEIVVTEVLQSVGKLEVVKQDGEQYVNINGVMYKVEK